MAQNQAAAVAAAKHRRLVSFDLLSLPFRHAPPAANLVEHPGFGGDLFRHWIPNKNLGGPLVLYVHEFDTAQYVVVFHTGSILLLFVVLFDVSATRRAVELCVAKTSTTGEGDGRRLRQSGYRGAEAPGPLDLYRCRLWKVQRSPRGMDLPRRSAPGPGYLFSAHDSRSTPVRPAGSGGTALDDSRRGMGGNSLRPGCAAGGVPGQLRYCQHLDFCHLQDAHRDLPDDTKFESVELCGLLCVACVSSDGVEQRWKQW
mmetsp:Transcript_7825/g.16123  ORF Transcript_7825/g.16123 Transcript_7825/m.16123 type:complete len:257 (+) Transcript_7825:429-1199(+)